MARVRRPLLLATATALILTQAHTPAHAATAGPPTARHTGPVPAAYTPAPAREEAGIVDLPVSFTVRNVNRSLAACATDGGTYTVRGHLTGPRDLLLGDGDRAITLYQHDIASGEWFWRLDAGGYDYTAELAARGHVSLTVDRLGYGASDRPHGADVCLGGDADIAHQIVQQLRDGTYTVPDGEPPAFERVFLAGQGNGAQLTQIAGYSFPGIDGLVLMDWTDLGLDPAANAPFLAALPTCLAGADNGYTHYDATPDDFAEANFADTEAAILEQAVPLRNPHPCGDMVSQPGAVLADIRHLPDVDVPVLLVFGAADDRVGDPEQQRALFTGADTELVTVPDAGHYPVFSREATVVHDAVAGWLTRHAV
ncbi:alpha/beta hydrolase [Streptomyces sp. RFCAC02]|uniref:alpha/beta hydrolase n=1 Tax=Streptomyces sp. RFCAC02 TaxID=2499143 RepID=UPI0010225BA1|nr:alpha/beta hydrolase [Streptomyces sp. RFCAC02]